MIFIIDYIEVLQIFSVLNYTSKLVHLNDLHFDTDH